MLATILPLNTDSSPSLTPLRRAKASRTLPVWKNFTTTPQDELFQICKKGFDFSDHEGMVVVNGGIDFGQDEYPENGSTMLFVMFDVILGKSILIDSKHSSDSHKLLPGYDSLMLQKSSTVDGDIDDYGEEDIESDKHVNKYKIFTPKNIQPRYIVKFVLDDEETISDDKQEGLDVYDRIDYFDVIKWKPVTLREKMTQLEKEGPDPGTLKKEGEREKGAKRRSEKACLRDIDSYTTIISIRNVSAFYLDVVSNANNTTSLTTRYALRRCPTRGDQGRVHAGPGSQSGGEFGHGGR